MRTNRRWLVAIAAVVLLALWIDLPNNPGINFALGPLKFNREIKVQEGLDLRGGVQVTLEADVPAGTLVGANTMEAARTIIENRINGLGVSEPQIQLQQETNRILVELPGVKNPEEAIASFRGTGLLEFVDTGSAGFPEGAVITTSLGAASSAPGAPAASANATPGASATSTAGAATSTPAPTARAR